MITHDLSHVHLQHPQTYKKGASAPIKTLSLSPPPPHIMKPISEETRNSIISLLDSGLSSRQIEAQLGVGHTTVDKVRASARPDAQKRSAGRPAKLTGVDKRRLVRMITSGKADTAVQVAQELKDTVGVEASAKTV